MSEVRIRIGAIYQHKYNGTYWLVQGIGRPIGEESKTVIHSPFSNLRQRWITPWDEFVSTFAFEEYYEEYN